MQKFNMDDEEANARAEAKEKKNNRKEAVAELIAQDRRWRAIKSMLRDEQGEQTEHLDKCYGEMRQLGMFQQLNRRDEKQSAAREPDPYDSMYQSLQFEPNQSAPKMESALVSSSIPSKSTNILPTVDETDAPSKSTFPEFNEAMEEFEQIVVEREENEAGSFKQWEERMNEFIGKRLHPALKKSPHAGSRILLEKLQSIRQQFYQSEQISNQLPNLRHLAFVQLISALFPTDLFFHPISTPTLAFGLELLAKSQIYDVPQCSRLIFLCSLLFQWANGNIPRYLPEVIAFLLGALQLAIFQPDENEQFPSFSFPISRPHREMLCLKKKSVKHLKKEEHLCLSTIFVQENGITNNRQKSLILRLLFKTIRQFAEKYSNIRQSFNAIFMKFHQLCLRLPIENYHTNLADEAKELEAFLAAKLAETATLTQMKIHRAPKELKMLEPRFDEHFNPERPNKMQGKGQNAAKQREKNWAKRFKRERRGAMKEMRKDAKHFAGMHSENQRKIRQERDEKTKRIMQTLEVQESEYKKLRAIGGKN